MESSTPTSAPVTVPEASGEGIRIAPSILSADFGNLAAEVAAVARGGAEVIHVDVMDGHFVPNITIGAVVVESLRKHTALPLDCHLMIEDPEEYAPRFIKAGAAMVSFHLEVLQGDRCRKLLRRIRNDGAQAGLVLNPETAASEALPYLDETDYVLVMAVQPGNSGQKFMPEARPKLRKLAAAIRERGLSVELEIDGGIGPKNIADVCRDGARLIVAGSSVFGDDPEAAVRRLRDLL